MSMLDELKHLTKIKIPAVQDGEAGTLGDFYDRFVKTNELKPSVVRKWYEVLTEYAKSLDDRALIFFVRKMEHEQRRGFVTRTSDGLSYVFSDNSLAKSIYLLAREGFAPKTANDFRDCVRAFRLKCMQMSNGDEKKQDAKGHFYSHFRRGSLPSLGGWFLAHILSANEFYRGKYKDFQSRYFVRGELSDWSYDANARYMVRKLPISCSPSDRRIFIAHFLRFLSPFNFFLVPLPRYISGNPAFKDISSTVPMLNLMRKIRAATYGSTWMTFENDVLFASDSYDVSPGQGEKTPINITVHAWSASTGASQVSAKAKAPVKAKVATVKPKATGVPKALAKIPHWAENPDCNAYRVIKAYFTAEFATGGALVKDVRHLCTVKGGDPKMSVPKFDASWHDMSCPDSGHSLGKVFDVQDGIAHVWPPVAATLNQYRSHFMA